VSPAITAVSEVTAMAVSPRVLKSITYRKRKSLLSFLIGQSRTSSTAAAECDRARRVVITNAATA
jgi:hypothetical protein